MTAQYKYFTKIIRPLAIGAAILLFLFAVVTPIHAVAGINKQINFQGKVVNANGTNVADGYYSFVFKLYNSAANGAAAIYTEDWTTSGLWAGTVSSRTDADTIVYATDTNESSLKEGQYLTNTTRSETVLIRSVDTGTNTLEVSDMRTTWAGSDAISNKIYVKDGVFRVTLGSLTALTSVDFNNTAIYLGTNFNGDGEMRPFVKYTAVPYAFNAEKVNGLTVTNTSDASFTSATYLKIGDGKTINLGANSITFTTSADSSLTLPTSGTVTALGNTTTGTGTTLVLSENPSFAGVTLSSGAITLGGSTGTGQCITGGATAAWGSCGTGSSTWTQDATNLVLYPAGPYTAVTDVLIGGSATASAKFAFTNINSGNPTASISGNLSLATPTTAGANTFNLLNNSTLNFQVSQGGDAGLTSALFIDKQGNSGKVGIGDSTPSFALDVNGDAQIQGGELYLSGVTSSASTTEGTIYYDTDDDQLKVYANGKWQSDRSTATKIVATTNTGNPSQNSEKADYVCGDTDCDTTIETAISALPTNGGVVVLLEGTYVIDSDGIDISKANVSLMGVGNATILQNGWNGGSNEALITITAADVIISDLAFDQNSGSFNTDRSIWTTTGSQAVAIRNNLFFNSTGSSLGAAIAVFISTNNIIENNIFKDGWTDTITVATANNVISNNQIAVSANAACIWITNAGGDKNVITDNYCIDGNGIEVGGNPEGLTISGNVIDTPDGVAGIYALLSNSSITGNVIISSTTHGISLEAGSINNSVVGNTIKEVGNAKSGIILASADNNIIANNRILDSACTGTCYGINISDSTSDNNYIIGNEITGAGIASNINDAGTGTTIQQRNQFEVEGTNTLGHLGLISGESVGKSLFNLNYTGSGQDIFTASAGGTLKFAIESDGDIKIAAGQSLDTLAAGSLLIGNTNANALTLGNSTVSTMTFNIDTAGNYVFQKEGAAFACTGTDKLTLNASGQLVCGSDQTGGGSTWTQDATNLVLYPTGPYTAVTDLILGGTSTASAKFAVLNVNSGTPVASIAGHLTVGQGAQIRSQYDDLQLAYKSAADAYTVGLSLEDITGRVVVPVGIALGTNPASAGVLRLPNDSYITARNAANSADINLIKINASDIAEIATSLVLAANSTINPTSAGTISLGTTNATGLTIGNSGATSGLTLNIDTAANYVFQKEGAAFACTGTDKLTLNASGQLVCGSDQTGGSGSTNWTLDTTNGLLRPNNNTVDFLIGGTSTASAKFAFTNINSGNPTASISGNLSLATPTTAGANTFNLLNNSTLNFQVSQGGDAGLTSALFIDKQGNSGKVGIGTTSPNSKLHVAGGDILIGSQTDSGGTSSDWTLNSQSTAGTISSGGTASIDKINVSAVYNGSLYIGTNEANSAEVYRYDGGTTWTKVSQSTAGTIASAGTANIDGVTAMVVYNGYLYIGTNEANSAEVYRYDGGTTWTKVSNTTAGTITASGTSSIDTVSAMAVGNGVLYIGTTEADKAEVYRYEGGSVWKKLNYAGTAGQIKQSGTTLIDGISSMVAFKGHIIVGTTETDKAEIYYLDNDTGMCTGCNAYWTLISYSAGRITNGDAVTTIDTVSAMAVYNGALYVGVKESNSAEIYRALDPSDDGTNNAASAQVGAFVKVSQSTAGTIASGGTANIDGVTAMTVYNGVLYVSTSEANSAEVYYYGGGTYNGTATWTKISQSTAGTIISGGTANIDEGLTLIPYNDNLYIGTSESNSAEIYSFSAIEGQSYALKFNAASDNGGAEQNSLLNTGSISFTAEQQSMGYAGANMTGRFNFSNGLSTAFGAYDVAEDYPTRDETLEPGDIVSIDPNEREFVKKSENENDNTAIGVYSSNPALRLSQKSASINGGKTIPVALAGRVPVKVSTESGKIEAGDYLTSSSKPGVAQKATKAGPVIGQALEPYDGDGVGKISVFIKNTNYNGERIANLFNSIDLNAPDSSNTILEQIAKSANSIDESSASEITTDRLLAGLEIITPKLTVDEIKVKKLKAEKIDGLDLMVKDQLSIINNQKATESAVLSAEDKIASITAELNARFASQSSIINYQPLSVNSEGLSMVPGSLRVKENGLVEGILTVIDTITTNNFIVNGLSTFFGDVVFKDKVIFEDDVTLSKNSAGIATIRKDSKEAIVELEKEYEDEDVIINVNLLIKDLSEDDYKAKVDQEVCSNNDSKDVCLEKVEKSLSDLNYIVIQKSNKKFVIKLAKEAEQDITFSWNIVRVKKEQTLAN